MNGQIINKFGQVNRNCSLCSTDKDIIPSRALPCHHPICQECFNRYIKMEINNGKTQLVCPYQNINGFCGKILPWSLVKQFLTLSANEIKILEENLTEKSLNTDAKVQQCPKCLIYMKLLNNVYKIYCKSCGTIFCWKCLGVWPPENTTIICKNRNCVERNELSNLRNCELVQISGMDCYSTRACVKCGVLIRYKANCKHMKCGICGQGFCFVCLRKVIGIKWPCDYNNPCILAPRQTTIGSATS